MIKRLAILFVIFSGLFFTISWLDHWHCLDYFWNKILPPIVLEREVTVQEQIGSDIQLRITRIQESINDIEQAIKDSRIQQNRIEAQLAEKLGNKANPSDQTITFLKENPIIAILVKTIDKEEINRQDLHNKLEQEQQNLLVLQARKMAVENGISLAELEPTPGNAIEATESGHTTEQQRYAAILRRVYNINQLENN